VSDLLPTSQQELTRLDAMQQLEEKTLEQKEAAEMLGGGRIACQANVESVSTIGSRWIDFQTAR